MAAALQYLAMSHLYYVVRAMLDRGDVEGAKAIIQPFCAMGDIQLSVVRRELPTINKDA